MGYVPPSAPELIRRDLEPMLSRLYGIYEVSAMRSGFPLPGSPSYRKYVNDLYGPQGRDWFPVWNYGLLAGLIALPIAIAWGILGG